MSSNHLDLKSVWKSLVASCVCVAEVRMRVFNAFVSSTKVFVSSAKRVHLLIRSWFHRRRKQLNFGGAE